MLVVSVLFIFDGNPVKVIIIKYVPLQLSWEYDLIVSKVIRTYLVNCLLHDSGIRRSPLAVLVFSIHPGYSVRSVLTLFLSSRIGIQEIRKNLHLIIQVNINILKMLELRLLPVFEEQLPRTNHDIKEYESKSWNYVITVCDHARETCPVFSGKVGQRLHLGFTDPAMAKGSEEEKLSVFRKVRNEIINSFNIFYRQISKKDF